MIIAHAAVRTRPSRLSRAFTIVELLIVILIITVVVSIVLPALASVRTTVRKASTRATMSDLSHACDQFKLDQRKQPGYFSAKDMGSTENQTRGFTAMQNILLDLAGGIVSATDLAPVGVWPQSDPNYRYQVGPLAASAVYVVPNRIGVSTNSKIYYTPPKQNFVLQDGQAGGTKMVTGNPNHNAIPDLIDSFGNPILAWVEDESAIGSITSVPEFARPDSTNPAHFYWASNAAFLTSSNLGKLARDQNLGPGATTWPSNIDLSTPIDGSLLGRADQAGALSAVLGNPSYPSPFNPTDPNSIRAIFPTASRGKVVFHSAGPDGYFFRVREKGFKQQQAANGPNAFEYWHAFSDPSTPSDVTKGFDDVLVSSGN
jgi:type II secretory pathway pseudopilin PulG